MNVCSLPFSVKYAELLCLFCCKKKIAIGAFYLILHWDSVVCLLHLSITKMTHKSKFRSCLVCLQYIVPRHLQIFRATGLPVLCSGFLTWFPGVFTANKLRSQQRQSLTALIIWHLWIQKMPLTWWTISLNYILLIHHDLGVVGASWLHVPISELYFRPHFYLLTSSWFHSVIFWNELWLFKSVGVGAGIC